MSLERNSEYGRQVDFWDKEEMTVVGDFCGRMPALQLLNPLPNEDILEAGSGTGFFARMIARREKNARIYGCEKDIGMLTAARAAEKPENAKKIQYENADIAETLGFGRRQFDAISCVGVLMHNTPEECKKFFTQAHMRLKTGGRLVISITHPELYPHTATYREEDRPWARHEFIGIRPASHLNADTPLYQEYYWDKNGKKSDYQVYAHSAEFLKRSLETVGFQVVREISQPITAEALQAVGRSGDAGVPGFYQLLARKPSPKLRE